jgi:predicted regulator of Ras-like GTPase activity (Roadblock/LC7/MglB family)
MHWLGDKLQGLEDLLIRLNEYKGMDAKAVAGAEAAAKKTREAFAENVRELVTAIASRDGITACFACHDGLLMENAGECSDFERLAVEGQKLINQGTASLERLDFGEFQQMVLVGRNKKVALFWMGEVGIGIVSTTDTVLSEQLKS